MDKKLNKAASKGDAAAIAKLSGVDFSAVDKKGNTALHLAAATGMIDACQVLIDLGVDPSVKNGKGQTAADVADGKKKKACAQFLRDNESGFGWKRVCAASVALFAYEDSNWKQVQPALVTLELQHCAKPYSYKLTAKVNGKPPLIDSVLKEDLQYSGATETFHNFAGTKTWGFNFADEDEAKNMLSQMQICHENLKNPPPPEEEKPAAAAPAASSGGPPPPPSGGGPPPPPPPPQPKAEGSPKPAAAKPVSMADAIAAKAAGGLASADERELDDGPAPVPPGGGGGNMMSELANRLKKRKPAAAPAGGGGGGGGGGAAAAEGGGGGVVGGAALRGGGGPNKGQVDEFKAALLDGFREELEAMKNDTIEKLRAEIQAM